jgi:hypothetical protein
MKPVLNKRKRSLTWKFGKTIMIYKGEEEDDPMNWRPITLTSVL